MQNYVSKMDKNKLTTAGVVNKQRLSTCSAPTSLIASVLSRQIGCWLTNFPAVAISASFPVR